MNLSRQAGFSLVGVLVAVGISAIVALVWAALAKQQLAMQARVEQRADFAAIQRTVLDRIDCGQTALPLRGGIPTAPVACPHVGLGLTPIDVLDRNGVVIVSSAGTRIGKWLVRAVCKDASPSLSPIVGNAGVSVQAARPKATIPSATAVVDAAAADFELDPLSRQPLTWARPGSSGTNAADVTPNTARLCSNDFDVVTTGCGPTAPPCTHTAKDHEVVTATIAVAGPGICSPGLLDVSSTYHVVVRSLPVGGGSPLGYWTPGDTAVLGNVRHFTGRALCSAGFHASGGGGNCQSGSPGAVMDSRLVQVGGVAVGWQIDCCRYVGPPVADGVFVICEKDR